MKLNGPKCDWETLRSAKETLGFSENCCLKVTKLLFPEVNGACKCPANQDILDSKSLNIGGVNETVDPLTAVVSSVVVSRASLGCDDSARTIAIPKSKIAEIAIQNADFNDTALFST